MSRPNALIIKARGLNTQPNELDVPEGSLRVAENVEITRDHVVQVSPGFSDYSTNLPDFEPQQLFAYGGTIYAHADDGIWYNSGGTWVRKGTAALSIFGSPASIWIDSGEDNAYLTDSEAHAVFKISLSTGFVSVLAGLPGTSGTSNGTKTAARFNNPQGIWGDGTNLYVCDKDNYAIRKIVISSGVVTTHAGLIGTAAYTDNATGTTARFQSPHGVWGDGTSLFVTESAHGRVRRVGIGGSASVTTLTSGLTEPRGVWVANAGATVYVMTDTNGVVKSIPIATGVASNLATGIGGMDTNTHMHGDGTYLWCALGGIETPAIARVTISGGAVATYFDNIGPYTFSCWAFTGKVWLICDSGIRVGNTSADTTYSLISGGNNTTRQSSGSILFVAGPD